MALLVLTVLVISIFWKPTQTLLYPVISPLIQAYVSIRDTGTGIPHTIVTYFTSRNEYEKRIIQLERDIEHLENELAYATMLAEGFDEQALDEEATSTEMVQFAGGRATQKLYPIISDATGIYDTVLITGGFDDGLEEGMIVYLRGYQAIGYIARVHKSSSVVSLYSSARERVNGVVKDIDTTLTLLGDGGGTYRIEAPKGVDLAPGQIVYLAHNQNMILGEIVDVTDDPQDTFIEAYVRGAYNPNKANIFYVDHQ